MKNLINITGHIIFNREITEKDHEDFLDMLEDFVESKGAFFGGVTSIGDDKE